MRSLAVCWAAAALAAAAVAGSAADTAPAPAPGEPIDVVALCLLPFYEACGVWWFQQQPGTTVPLFTPLDNDLSQLCSPACVATTDGLCTIDACSTLYDQLFQVEDACNVLIVRDGDGIGIAPNLVAVAASVAISGTGWDCEALFTEVGAGNTSNANCLDASDPPASCMASPCPEVGGPYAADQPQCNTMYPEPFDPIMGARPDCQAGGGPPGFGPTNCIPEGCNPRPGLSWTWNYMSAANNGCTCCNRIVQMQETCADFVGVQPAIFGATYSACIAPPAP